MYFLFGLWLLLVPVQDDPALLVERLDADDLEMREEAFEKLQLLGEKAAPFLEKVKNQGGPEFRNRVAELLEQVRKARIVPEQFRNRKALADLLAGGGDEAWTTAFLSTEDLSTEDLTVLLPRALRGAKKGKDQSDIFMIVYRKQAPQLFRALLLAIKDETIPPVVRITALHFYAGHAGEGAVPFLLPFLQSEDPDIRAYTVMRLADIRTDAVTPTILEHLDDPAAAVRRAAMSAMMRRPRPDQESRIAKHLTDVDDMVLIETIRTLSSWNITSRWREVARQLNHRDPFVRHAAIDALGGFGVEESAAHLLPLLDTEESKLRKAILRALEKIGSRSCTPTVISLFTDSDPGVRVNAVRTMRKLAGPDDVDDLVKILKHSDPAMKRSALDILGLTGSAEAVEPVAAILADDFTDPGVWRDAARALGRLPGRASADFVRNYVRSTMRNDERRRTLFDFAMAGPNGGRLMSLLTEIEARALDTLPVEEIYRGERGTVLKKVIDDAGWTLQPPSFALILSPVRIEGGSFGDAMRTIFDGSGLGFVVLPDRHIEVGPPDVIRKAWRKHGAPLPD